METLSQTADPPMDVLVVGDGATAICVGAGLLGLGQRLTLLTSNALLADAVNVRGLQCVGAQPTPRRRCRAVTSVDRGARFDLLLLATGRDEAARELRRALPHLREEGVLLSFVRGLFEPQLPGCGAPAHAFGAVACWGASMLEPGVADYTAAGSLVLGALEGLSHPGWDALEPVPPSPGETCPDPDPGAKEEAECRPQKATEASSEALRKVARVLESVAPVTVTHNLLGARWSQMAWESVVDPLGYLGGARLGEIARRPCVLQLAIEALGEAVGVARAAGVRLEKLPGTLDLAELAADDLEEPPFASEGYSQHGWLGAVASRFGRVQSRLTTTAKRHSTVVARANELLVTAGQAFDVDTPRQQRLARAVLAASRGRHELGPELLEQLCAGAYP